MILNYGSGGSKERESSATIAFEYRWCTHSVHLFNFRSFRMNFIYRPTLREKSETDMDKWEYKRCFKVDCPEDGRCICY